VSINDLEPAVNIRVFRHLHSTNTGITDPHAVPIAASSGGGMSAHTDKGRHLPLQPGGPARSAAISSRHATVICDANRYEPHRRNGERDIVTYLQHVRPRFFIPNHVTAVAVEGSSLYGRLASLTR
jgi:hypothetical protein